MLKSSAHTRAMTQAVLHASPLAEAFEHCEALTLEHSKSFYMATALLPKAKRLAIRALYAFCRTTDDIVDTTPGIMREAQLSDWRLQAQRNWREQQNPVLKAWTWVRDQYEVPTRFSNELIDGCESDLRVCRYDTWDELRRYCYLVASTVGLMSMHIIGTRDQSTSTLAEAEAEAIELGVALQLTNVLRDVGEDLERGRIYLPREDMERFGYTEDDLRRHVNDDRFKRLMRFEMDRADALYDESWRGLRYLRPDGRLAVGAASLLYRGILGRIHANSYDVFTRRAHLSTPQKIARLPAIWVRVMTLN